MRTTVTLDEDVAALLQQAARQRGVSFKKVLNEAVRAGLRQGPAPETRRYVVEARPMGVRSDIDLDRALQLADSLADEAVANQLRSRSA
jgi:hypothetical protein